MPRATDATPQMRNKSINLGTTSTSFVKRKDERRKRADTREAKVCSAERVAEPHASRIAEIQWQRTCHPLVISAAVRTTKLQRMAEKKPTDDKVIQHHIVETNREHARRSPTPYNASSDLRYLAVDQPPLWRKWCLRYASSAESAGDVSQQPGHPAPRLQGVC